MHLNEILLGNNINKGDVIEGHIEKIVIIKDSNEGWCYGRIENNYIKIGEYKLLIQDARGERILKYDNLEVFLETRPSRIERF